MCTRNLITKFAVVVTGILVSLDLFAQDAPASIEWERAITPSIAVPTTPGVMLALLGLALLAYGTHRIWRQRNTSVRLLAIVAMTGGIMLAIQSAPHLIGVANAVPPTISQIILDESPKALDFGDNAIKNVQSFAVRITALRDGTGKVDQGLASTPKCQVGAVLAPDEVCFAYVEELLTCPCWNTFTESELVAAMNAEIPSVPDCRSIYAGIRYAFDEADGVPRLRSEGVPAPFDNYCVLRVGPHTTEIVGLEDPESMDCDAEAATVISKITWCPYEPE